MNIPPGMPRLKGFRFPREIIAYAVWAYHRFAMSPANVEDLLAERSVIVSREAIREDLFLRIRDVVKEAGTELAFPSQTLYLAQNGGMDGKRAQAGSAAVDSWRQNGKLPFPHLPPDTVEELQGILDYPPKGSFTAGEVPLNPSANATPRSPARRV